MKVSHLSSLFLVLLCTIRSAYSSFCSCSNGTNAGTTCKCSGNEISVISTLFSADLCKDGTPSSLILEDLPNLAQMSEGIEPPIQSGCVGWSGLTSLTLRRTGIQNVSTTMFRGLYNLQFLDFSNNSNINSYRDEVFRSIGGTLLELVATDNKVHSLTKRVFSGLRVIQRLELSRNKIGYIEAGAFSNECCSQLTELRLDFNILTELEDDTFQGLTNMRVLDLRGNPLQKLSSRLFSPFAASLTHLWISHDDNAGFGGFPSLPANLFEEMSQLQVLEMAEMKLRNLTPVSFKGLNNLRELNLRGNRLTVIPKSCFSSLPRLEKLDLSSNAIVCLPDASHEKYEFLRWLDISWNGITHLTRQAFTGLASSPPTSEYPSFVLNISNNPVQRIEPDAFCSLKGSSKLIVSTELDGADGQSASHWSTMSNWPESPFALIGNESVVQGLRGIKGPVNGRDDASIVCAPGGELLRSAILASPLYTNSKYSQQQIDASRTSECPWLAPPKISQWQLSKLGVPGLSGKPKDNNGENVMEQGSRIYLLIIIAVCVTFLLAALTIIMCYRAWSRRACRKLNDADFEAHMSGENGFAGTIPENLAEKHELLEKVHIAPSNGKVAPTGEGLGTLSEKSESNESNSKSHSPKVALIPAETTGKSSDVRQLSASPNDEATKHSRSARRNSEPHGEEMEHVTAFGVL